MEWQQQTIQRILAKALERGGDFADLFIEERHSLNLVREAEKLDKVTAGTDAGAGVRVVSQGSTAYAYTNDLTESGLLEIAGVVANAVEQGNYMEIPVLEARTSQVQVDPEIDPRTISLVEKAALLEKADRAAREVDPRVTQVTVFYRESIQDVLIANSRGYLAKDTRCRLALGLLVIARAGEVMQTAYESLGGSAGFELLAEEAVIAMARKAAEAAVRMLSAKPAPSGKMPVVLAAEAGGTMVHEACGHGLEADLVQKGVSVYAGKIGQQVAAKGVTVIDDATLPHQYGSYRFDDEGNPAQRNVLIEDGILKGYLYDLVTALKDGQEPTGNGRRQSYHHRPIPRMSNTFIAPGSESPEEIIKDTPSGLYVTKMGGGQVNTATGDFVFEVAQGFLIKDGRIAEPVRGATLTGNGPEVLKLIDRIGNDQGFTIGTCGKDGQGAPVCDAQPTIRIKELIVGGIAENEEVAQ
ncbi:MAG: TldD/PmbA family protein [Firmicutes bacterium]|nr:TldD/PmbA family protein [Bacillota bacterium]